jgi:predicted DNA-binding transcriptional regulator YafY
MRYLGAGSTGVFHGDEVREPGESFVPSPSDRSAFGHAGLHSQRDWCRWHTDDETRVGCVNRTDRLYALVEELRVVAPRPRSARWLAQRFEVSTRTVERDLSALQQTGVPIWAEAGRTGGYCIDPSHTLAPLGFTVDEALAVTIALGMLTTTPFQSSATSALRKVAAVMDDRSLLETAESATRMHLLDNGLTADAPAELAHALRTGNVLHVVYKDRGGNKTSRDVEPLGYIGRGNDWYLIAWCRLRDGVRAFRGDRIITAEPTGERPPRRPFRAEDLDIPYGGLRPIRIGTEYR